MCLINMKSFLALTFLLFTLPCKGDTLESNLVGTWTLKSFVIVKGSKQKEWGQNSHGMLIYTQDGHMSVAINSKEDVLFYAGTYSVEGHLIKHKVLNATKQDRIEKVMDRWAKFGNGTLEIVGKGSYGEARLTWEKK